MLFISKNEDGVPAWKLVLEGKKTVTRRIFLNGRERLFHPGKVFACQPGRGKKAVCYCEVVSIMPSAQFDGLILAQGIRQMGSDVEACRREAELEGFKSIEGLRQWFKDHKINVDMTYRILFKVVRKC